MRTPRPLAQRMWWMKMQVQRLVRRRLRPEMILARLPRRMQLQLLKRTSLPVMLKRRSTLMLRPQQLDSSLVLVQQRRC
jgi:hypothetical protein